jgi:hypothetical protein
MNVLFEISAQEGAAVFKLRGLHWVNKAKGIIDE